MFIINYIYYKYKRSIKFFLCTPFLFNKSIISGNFADVEDLNIIQIG